jgi:Calcineurin-like phosphoesterase
MLANYRRGVEMIGLLKKRAKKKRGQGLPEGLRIYAIGDVHGRADLLDRLLSRIDTHITAHPTVRPIYLLIGDYIDRGPDSREVLELLINCSQGREMVFLRGNHEAFVEDFLKDPAALRDWSKVGGLETLMSYGLQPPINADSAVQKELAQAFNARLPKAHRDFLDQLVTSFTCGGYFFAHAGVRPGIPLSKQKQDDLLWIRDDFLLHEEDFGKIVVHGHTPVREIDIKPNRINIDTGAYVTGRLSCLIIEGDRAEPL